MFKNVNISSMFSGFNSKKSQNAPDQMPKTRPSTPGNSTKDGRSSFQETPYRPTNNSLLNMSNPFEKVKERGRSESPIVFSAQNPIDQEPSTENLLDRSVKITFPKNNESEIISEASMRERVGQFGEVINVGMKEKLAVVLFATSTQALVFCVFHNNVLGNNYKIKYMGTKSMSDEELQEQMLRYQEVQKRASPVHIPVAVPSSPAPPVIVKRPPPTPHSGPQHQDRLPVSNSLSQLAIPGRFKEVEERERDKFPLEDTDPIFRSRNRSGDSETETDNDCEDGRGGAQWTVSRAIAAQPSPISTDLSVRSFADRSDCLGTNRSQGALSQNMLGSIECRQSHGIGKEEIQNSLARAEDSSYESRDIDGRQGHGWAEISASRRGGEQPSPSLRSVITMDTAPGERSPRSQQELAKTTNNTAVELLRAQEELRRVESRPAAARDSWKSAKAINSQNSASCNISMQTSEGKETDLFDSNADESSSQSKMEAELGSGSTRQGPVLQVKKMSYTSQSDSASDKHKVSINTVTEKSSHARLDSKSGLDSSDPPSGSSVVRSRTIVGHTSTSTSTSGSELDEFMPVGRRLADSEQKVRKASFAYDTEEATGSNLDDDSHADGRAVSIDRYSSMFVNPEKQQSRGFVSSQKNKSVNSRSNNSSSANQTKTDSSSESENSRDGSSPTKSLEHHRHGQRDNSMVIKEREGGDREERELISSSNSPNGGQSRSLSVSTHLSANQRSSPSRSARRRKRAGEHISPPDASLSRSGAEKVSLFPATEDLERQIAALMKKVLLLEAEGKARRRERDEMRLEGKRNEDLWVAELSSLTMRNVALEEEGRQLRENMQNSRIQSTIKDAKISVLEGSLRCVREELASTNTTGIRTIDKRGGALADVADGEEMSPYTNRPATSTRECSSVDMSSKEHPAQSGPVTLCATAKQGENEVAVEVEVEASPPSHATQPVPPVPSVVIISVAASAAARTEYPLSVSRSLFEDLRSTRKELDKYSQLTLPSSSSSSNTYNATSSELRRASHGPGELSSRYGIDGTDCVLYSIARGDYFNSKAHGDTRISSQRPHLDSYRSDTTYPFVPQSRQIKGNLSAPLPPAAHLCPTPSTPLMSYYSHLLPPSNSSLNQHSTLSISGALSDKAGRRREYLARLHDAQ